MNINKIFSRLTITAKLAIAFVLVATLPLVLVGVVGALSAVRTLRDSAESMLERDVGLAEIGTSRSFRELEQHLSFLTEIGISGLLRDDPPTDSATVAWIAEAYMAADPTALQRVKLIDANGVLRFVAQREGTPLVRAEAGEAGEAFYLWMARELEPGQRRFLPVELRADGGGAVIAPSVAVLVPLQDDRGGTAGVLVGEASAEVLFENVEAASPGLEGVTALVDQDGLFLYHSTRKRDWAQLLADRSQVTLETEFGESAARRMLSTGSGLMSTLIGSVVAYRRVELGSSSEYLVLFRSVPLASVTASVKRYLKLFVWLGGTVALLVLGVSVVAARQITRPIYRLRHAAARMMRGGDMGPLVIETNDEIEDFARDFKAMAHALETHRRGLETLVDERTKALRSARVELSQIVTYSADAIVSVDTDSRIRLWNRGAERLFGYAGEEVVGRPVAEVLGCPGEGNVAEATFLRRSLDTGEPVVNYRTARVDRDGMPIAVSLTQSPILDDASQVVGHSLILRDDRAQQKLDEQMRRSERLAAVSLMAAGLAHELNNPLAVLGNRIELMQRDAQKNGRDDRLRRDLEVLRQHVGRIGAITTDLLRFARDDMDDLGPLEINGVVQRVIRLVERMFVASGIHVRSELGDPIPPVQANRSAVETVLVNLLLNAQQATPRGGTVTVTTRYRADEECAEITVVDDGPGIPADIRGRIFEPFFTTKAGRGGTGLGLAVCQTLMDRQGGRIALNAGYEPGAAFELLFSVYAGAT